jgi:predicted AAA+ superfamily ATPase
MQEILELLIENSARLIADCNTPYKRYFFKHIDFNQKMIGIVGARGVGKTTAILQHLRDIQIPYRHKLYISADMIEIADMHLFDIAKFFEMQGGKILAIDEIHKNRNFESELKNIYDRLKLQVIFSGSSALQVEHAKADLSRRALMYRVQGLSFREFCEMKLDMRLPVYGLEDILHHHTEIAADLVTQLKPLEHFSEYLKTGYYPFYFDDGKHYLTKLESTVNTVIEVDLPSLFSLKYDHIVNLKKLVKLICGSEPYSVNISRLSKQIGITRDMLYRYIDYLHRGSVFLPVKAKSRGDGIFTKPEKLYLHNTNLYHAYCIQSSKGTIRETFFANTTSLSHTLHHTKVGDFLLDERFVFEVGGRKKSFSQIKEIPDSYIAADELEIGTGNKIPLWLFGFLY